MAFYSVMMQCSNYSSDPVTVIWPQHTLRNHAANPDDHARHVGLSGDHALIGLNFEHGADIDMLRDSVARFGAGTSEIRRMLIGRELFCGNVLTGVLK